MSYIRFSLDLAIKQPMPSALNTALPTIKTKILQLKSYAEKINAGKNNEELTIKASYHICHHDEGGGCEPEINII